MTIILAQIFNEMSKIGNNIKKIRSLKKLNQTQFADIFGLSRTSIGAYEEGRAEPKTDTIIQIANKYGLSLDALLTREITINEIVHFKTPNDKYIGNQAPPTTQENTITTIDFIQINNHQDYISSNAPHNFEQIALPNTHPNFHKAFEEPLSKDILITKNAPSAVLKKDKYYVIHTHRQLHFAYLESLNKEKIIVFSSGQNIEFTKEDIVQLWEVTAIVTKNISQKTPIEKKITELEKRIAKMEKKDI